MIPIAKFNLKNDEVKTLKGKLATINEEYETILNAKELELYNLSTENMSELEKAKADAKRVKEENSKYAKKFNRMSAEAKLIKGGITNEDYINELLDSIVSDDELQTNKATDAFLKVYSAGIGDVARRVEEDIISESTQVETKGKKPDVATPTDDIDDILDEVWE